MPNNERCASEDLPRCASLPDLLRLDGQRVRLEGLYDVARVAGSKRLQPATVTLDDGTVLLRSYGPVPEEFCFLEKRVAVVGTVSSGMDADPMVQQVVAPHLRPEQIRLAQGAAPWPAPATELPRPPAATDRASMEGRAGLWVRVQGKLEVLDVPEDDPFWARACVRLADGTKVEISPVPTNSWEPLRAMDVQVTGRTRDGAPGAGGCFLLEGPTRVESI